MGVNNERYQMGAWLFSWVVVEVGRHMALARYM